MRSTKAPIVAAVQVGLLVFILGCNGTQSSQTVALPIEAKPDYFDKKQKCAEYLQQYKKSLEKESLESYQLFSSGHIKEVENSSLYKICYSKAKNTCVAFVTTTTRRIPRGPIMAERFSANDALTDDLVSSSQYGFFGRKISSEDQKKERSEYWKQRQEVFKEVDCAE